MRGAARDAGALEARNGRWNRDPVERRTALLELLGAERIGGEREWHLAGDDQIGEQRVAAAHRDAVGGDDVAKELQPARLAQAADQRTEPVAVGRLDAEPALPARIKQIVVT